MTDKETQIKHLEFMIKGWKQNIEEDEEALKELKTKLKKATEELKELKNIS